MKILIKGASKGIGAETAKFLAKDNQIIIHYNTSEKEAQNVVKLVEEKGGQTFLIQADLATEAGCNKLSDYLYTDHDSLDVLINNVGGMYKRHSVEEIDWNLLLDVFSLNTFSTMYLTSKVIPLLKKSKCANIINLTSLAIRIGVPTATAYAASKGAIDVFTRGLANALAPTVRVNAIAPGYIDTPFHDKVTNEEKASWMISKTPLKKAGVSLDVARTIQYIIESDFLTGETIDINGGFYMR